MLTVGELKAILAEHPDDLRVVFYVGCCVDGYDDLNPNGIGQIRPRINATHDKFMRGDHQPEDATFEIDKVRYSLVETALAL